MRSAIWVLAMWVLITVVPCSARADAISDVKAALEAQQRGDAEQALMLYTRAIDSENLGAVNLAMAYTNRASLYEAAVTNCATEAAGGPAAAV